MGAKKGVNYKEVFNAVKALQDAGVSSSRTAKALSLSVNTVNKYFNSSSYEEHAQNLRKAKLEKEAEKKNNVSLKEDGDRGPTENAIIKDTSTASHLASLASILLRMEKQIIGIEKSLLELRSKTIKPKKGKLW